VATVSLIHTARVDGATLEAARALMDAAFGGEFGEDDRDHALGGLEEDPGAPAPRTLGAGPCVHTAAHRPRSGFRGQAATHRC